MVSTAGSPVVNLATVQEPQRAALWARSASTLFPGLFVTKPPVNPTLGMIQRTPLGAGCLWTILSPPLLVSYAPSQRADAVPLFSVMLQLEGSTAVLQAGRICQVDPGDFCVIDGLEPFELEVAHDCSRVLFLQMPRQAVLSRNAELESRTAQRFSGQEPGAALLKSLLHGLLETAPLLDREQQAAALAGVIQLLGAPKLPGEERALTKASQRVAETLALIDAELSDPMLNAQRIAHAQGLSRRRLDQILLGSLGTSVTAQIWTRRLRQAASDLLDARFALKTVTQIAFGVGFEDTAHFARAFKKRYHCTPREWRSRMGEPARAVNSAPAERFCQEELAPGG